MTRLCILAALALSGCAGEPWLTPEQGAIINQGFQQAAANIASGRSEIPALPPVQYQMPPPLPIYQPAPMQNYQIDTPQYQRFNGASPGQIHY